MVAQFREQQEALNAQLATQQRALARTQQELREREAFYRAQIEQLSADNDPERQRAIAEYANGNRVQAIESLIAQEQQQESRDTKDRAARWRQIAALSFGVDTSRAIAAFEQTLVYQPNDFEASLFLVDLYIQTGQADRALHVASAAVDAAQDGIPRFLAQVAAGRSSLAIGRVDDAQRFFEGARLLLVRLLGGGPQSEALRLSYYFDFQYGAYLGSRGNLAGAERWFDVQIPFLREQLRLGLFPADIQYAFPMTLLVAASNSTRLGLKARSLERVGELGRLISSVNVNQVADANMIATVSNARMVISGVELRFESYDGALNAARQAKESARRAAAIDPSNSYFRMTLASALYVSAWANILTGNLAAGTADAQEAASIAQPLYDANRSDFFASLIFAICMFYLSISRFLNGARQEAVLLSEQSVAILEPFSALSAQNATLGLTVWYLRAARAALGLGDTWQRFEEQSADLVRAGQITSYELDYVRQVRQELLNRYHVSPTP